MYTRKIFNATRKLGNVRKGRRIRKTTCKHIHLQGQQNNNSNNAQKMADYAMVQIPIKYFSILENNSELDVLKNHIT